VAVERSADLENREQKVEFAEKKAAARFLTPNGLSKFEICATVPPLPGRRAADGAEEKAGHSGRDDGVRKNRRKLRKAA
jgi:hypothetical protein